MEYGQILCTTHGTIIIDMTMIIVYSKFALYIEHSPLKLTQGMKREAISFYPANP